MKRKKDMEEENKVVEMEEVGREKKVKEEKDKESEEKEEREVEVGEEEEEIHMQMLK